MTSVMSDNFVGTPGQAFTGDSIYSITAGSAVFAPSHYGVGLKFAAGVQAHVTQVSFTATTGPRVFSRIYKLSATPTGAGEIFHVRTASAKVCAASILASTGQLRILNADGSANSTSTASVPIGTEFRVVYTVNGTSFTAAIYPDLTSTTPTQTISTAITSASFTNTREGACTALAGADITLAWPVDDNASDPGLRVYVYVTLDKTNGIVPKVVNATAAVENAPAGTQAWTFTWGDGATTGPQASATASHTYTTTGASSATVTLDIT